MGRGNDASVAAALAAYRSGRAADARGAGRLESALAWNDRACTADPRDPRYATQGARLATLKGDHVAAFDRFATLLRSAPRTTGVWSELVLAAHASGQYREASDLCVAAYDADPTLAPALQALLNLLPDTATVDSPAASVPLLRLPISVVVCSNGDAQYAAMAASYGHALAGWPYLHGSVIYPDGSGYRVTAYSRTVPVAHSIRVIDGVFLAMKREIAVSIG